MISSLSFISHDRQPPQLSGSLLSQLSGNACEAKECSEHPPSGMLSPKATVQSGSLLAGALTSAESSEQDNSTSLGVTAETTMRSPGIQAQQGSRGRDLCTYIYGISTPQTTQPLPVTTFLPRVTTIQCN